MWDPRENCRPNDLKNGEYVNYNNEVCNKHGHPEKTTYGQGYTCSHGTIKKDDWHGNK